MFENRRLIVYLVAACAWIATQSIGAERESATGKITGAQRVELPAWLKDSFLDILEDVAEASEQGKHLMLFFYLSDCPYCHKMLEEDFEDAPYRQFIQDNFDVIAIDIRGAREVAFTPELHLTEKELARHLGVRYTPTILFLDRDNQVVLRLNGYRSPQAFKYALDFVQEQAYRSGSLSQYIERKANKPVYVLRKDSAFSSITDLHKITDKPLAVIFEDKTCDECNAFREEVLGRAETKALLEKFTVVRLDALSDEAIIEPSGKPSTPKAFAAELGISYRPGVVLFDKGKEIIRIDGMLRSFHFQQVLRYVADKQYEQYPSFSGYRRASQQEILKSGRDIDIWK